MGGERELMQGAGKKAEERQEHGAGDWWASWPSLRGTEKSLLVQWSLQTAHLSSPLSIQDDGGAWTLTPARAARTLTFLTHLRPHHSPPTPGEA